MQASGPIPTLDSRSGQLRCRIRLVQSLLAISLLVGAGCIGPGGLFRRAPQAPVVFEGIPAGDHLLATIRANSGNVRQLESDVKVTMDGVPAGATGTLLVERPCRMRMKVGVLGMTNSGVDIGTNEEVFWIFNKSSLGGQNPALYFARHDQFRSSQLQQSVPLQPGWLIEALGLIDVDSLVDVQGPFQRNDGFLELRTTIPGPRGNMNRVLAVDPRHGWIVQQAIYDTDTRLIAWSRSSKFRYYPERQASLPGHVEMHAVGPDGQTTRIGVTLNSHNINQLYVDPALTWQMPRPADVPRIDLSAVGSAGIPPATAHSARYSTPRPWRPGQLRGFNLR